MPVSFGNETNCKLPLRCTKNKRLKKRTCLCERQKTLIENTVMSLQCPGNPLRYEMLVWASTQKATVNLCWNPPEKTTTTKKLFSKTIWLLRSSRTNIYFLHRVHKSDCVDVMLLSQSAFAKRLDGFYNLCQVSLKRQKLKWSISDSRWQEVESLCSTIKINPFWTLKHIDLLERLPKDYYKPVNERKIGFYWGNKWNDQLLSLWVCLFSPNVKLSNY